MPKLNNNTEYNGCESIERDQSWTEVQMQLSKIKVRLDDVIQEPKHYRNLLDRIEMLGEDDEVELILDTVGGSLDGCIAICDAVQATEATVTAVLLNKVYSAGSAIALVCDNIEVRPNARMMLHSWSANGFSGKSHEIKSDYQFTEKYNEAFLWSCYENFLTPEEFQTMQNGVDFWFNSEEIIERLKKRQMILQEKYEKDNKQLQTEDSCEGCDCSEENEFKEYVLTED